MRVGICSVGAELLSGEVVDTNASWLSGRVHESGCRVTATLIIGDDREELVDAFMWLARRCDVLVVGGGLGPTADDLTRDAVADLAGVQLERRRELTDHLDAVYERLERDMPANALRQADIPDGAQVHPPEGTAAGFSLDVEVEGAPLRIHVLPGVPWEYKGLAERVVLPELVERSGGVARITRVLHIAGLGESGVGEALTEVSARLDAALRDPSDPEHGIELAYLANAGEVLVKVTATGASPKAAEDRAAPIVEEAAGLLGDAVTSIDERRLEDELGRLLIELGATVATAEGFTAGRVAAALSSVPGSEQYLRGGFVAYGPQGPVDLLDIDDEVAAEAGGVGRALAEAMARAAQQRCGADLAVATVGVTDGEDDAEPPVGTAVWAIALPDGTVEVEERYIPAGDRDIIQVRGAAFALESLRRHLVAQGKAGTVVRVTP